MWGSAEVQKVLKSAVPRPWKLADAALTVDFPKAVKAGKPVKAVESVKEAKKAFIPGSRLKNAMGRGPIFTGKPLVLTPIRETL